MRAVTQGVLETAGHTFLLLIAVRWFEAGATSKALVASGGSIGLMISPVVVSMVARARWRATTAAAVIALAGSLTFLLMAAVPLLPIYVVGSIVSMAASSALIPLMTQVYQENYPDRTRGALFSRTVIIRIGAAGLFAEFAGRILSGNIEYFRWLLLLFGAAFGFASFCLQRCPSRRLINLGGTHPLRSLRFVGHDRVFRWTLACWMVMGFANLMMLPLRVEYLANPRYGLSLTVAEIAFLTAVLPNMARLLMSPFWGWLFDRMNFFALRMAVNIGFALGMVSFFTTDSLSGLLIGAVVFGISNAGGDVAWSLWVTKFAPPDHVADYMSVHTFFTGLRGIVAPLAAFHLVRHFSVDALGWVATALILTSTAMLAVEVKSGSASGQSAGTGDKLIE